MSGIVRANNTGQSGLVTNTETIDSDDYVDASIDNAHIADGAVDTEEIADDAVTADKLADAINTSIAANTAKTTNATHSGDVTGATTLTIATDAVEGSMVHSNVVDNSTLEQSGTQFRIKDNGVTLAKMAGLARGTLIYGDTSGDPAALAAGAEDQVLTHDGTDFSWEDLAGGGNAYAGYFTRSESTASGTQAITGVGFTVKAVFFTMSEDQILGGNLSIGVDDGTTANSMGDSQAHGYGINYNFVDTDDSIFMENESGWPYQGHITTLGDDGFTITWARSGSPSGTMSIQYLAFG